jgi:hypothetical protein
MRFLVVLPVALGLLTAPLPAVAAQPAACPVRPELALPDLELPRSAAAVTTRKRLVVLALGGAVTTGTTAGGDAYTYPARLQARLRAALPGIEVSVTPRAAVHRSAQEMLNRLDGDLAKTHPDLVVWGIGGVEAGRHAPVEKFADTLDLGIDKAAAAGADMILMDVLYAPSIARVVDLMPYRDATLATGAAHGVAVLDRYQLMQEWNDSGELALDATDPAERVQVARKLFDCLAAVLSDNIAAAVHRP